MFKDKKILITGGTGSLGKALTKKLLETDIDTIRIFSREEFKQVQMKSEIDDERIRFLIGDVRDKERLKRAMKDIDIVIHAAALKQISVAEYNPFEAVKTNVNGSQNLINVCLDEGVEIALGIGTDKAVSPFNTYGATKLLMERLFISGNNYRGTTNTKFLAVRYGNVLGSRGSILPIFIDQILSGNEITITDPNMTRFNITMTQALDLIIRSLKNATGGEVFVPKLKAYKLQTFVEALIELYNAKNKIKNIPIRIGEKIHESLISEEELRITYENESDYVIYDTLEKEAQFYKNTKIKKTNLNKKYSSDNVDLLSKNEIKSIIMKQDVFRDRAK